MNLTDTNVVWTPRTGKVRTEAKGARWDRTPGDFWMPADSLWEFGGHPTVGDVTKQHLAMFILFNTIVVRDGVDVGAAHKAFLTIDEYRQSISPDTPGADA